MPHPPAHAHSLWRYPVKSMRGEALCEAFVGFAGVYGDRLYAFSRAGARKGFPFLTARDRPEMLLFHPAFRHPALALQPPNRAEAEALGPGITPLYPSLHDLTVDIRTPTGTLHPIDDPALLAALSDPATPNDQVSLLRSERALTDCRPVSLISLQTIRQVGADSGISIEHRRFRANIVVDLGDAPGFAEDAWVGRILRIGARLTIAVTGRDPRCKMITLDPDTAEARPEVLRCVARGHEGYAGVYAAVLEEGMIRPNDEIHLLDRFPAAGPA